MIESTFKDKKFETFITEENKKNSSDIFSVTYENQKYWVKKARATSSNIFHKIFYKLLNIDVLLPVEDKTKEEALLFETNKLLEFKKLGISVPDVIGRNSECFVLKDQGKNIHSLIKKRDIVKQDMYYYVDKMIVLLSQIHNSSNFHGGPQSRNFIYSDNNISVIDLEESFTPETDIQKLQIRDLLLFLMSLSKTRASFDVDYMYVLKKYEHLTENKNFRFELKKISSQISFLITLGDLKIFRYFLSEEINSFVRLFNMLKEIKEC